MFKIEDDKEYEQFYISSGKYVLPEELFKDLLEEIKKLKEQKNLLEEKLRRRKKDV